MTKIETNFEKLNHYQDIETYYPPLDDIKDFLYELFGDRVESQKYIVRTNQKIEQLQSNWNSLNEFVDYQLKHNVGSSAESSIRNHVYQEIKDKMNELEGGKNENRS